MSREKPRFGLRNILALLALTGWSWYAAAAGPELGLPGRDLGSLASGLAAQGLWFVPVGLLTPLALPRVRGLLTGFFLVLLPSLALGALATVLIAAAPAAEPWRVFGDFAAPEILGLLGPMAGVFAGVLLGAMLARGLGSALILLPAVVAVGAVLLAVVAVAMLLLSDRVAAVEPIGPPGSPAEVRAALADLVPSGDGHAPTILAGPALRASFRLALAAAGADPGLRLQLVPAGDALEVTASLPTQLPLLGERFFNLTAACRPAIEDGVFRASFESLVVGSLPLPATWVRTASAPFSRWLARQPAVALLASQFDEIRVENSRLVIGRVSARFAPPGQAPLTGLAILPTPAGARHW